MSIGHKLCWGLAAIVLSTGCVSQSRTADTASATGEKSWAGQMQGMAHEVLGLIPYIYSRKAYLAPENRKVIERNLEKLSQNVHDLPKQKGEKVLGPDPILDYSLASLKSDVERARESFQMGQLEYSRGVAKSVMNHCFRCHSMAENGGKAHWDLSMFSNISLHPSEKADLLVASRQFQEAEAYMEKLLSGHEFAQQYPFDYESMLRKYLAVMVRVEKKPKEAAQALDRVIDNEAAPFYVKEQARSWQQSLLDWAKSQGKEPQKPAAMLAAAELHITKGEKKQSFSKDHAGDVEFLRATQLLHNYIQTRPPAASLAKAYSMLGNAYEVLDELGYWNLHEAYFESCITTVPKSPLARRCYQRLQSSIYFGYSGSSGVHIPSNERERLQRLRKMIQ